MDRKYRFPSASAPDIVSSYQKDITSYTALTSGLTDIIRRIYGARASHTYSAETRAFTELLYFGLTTLPGNRTLGEEYCDIVQVQVNDSGLPSLRRRAGYILASVVFPYALSKSLPKMRGKLRRALEKSSHQDSPLRASVLNNLDLIVSPSPISYLTLMIFYFGGDFYHLGKRVVGLRYVLSHKTTQQHQGYEVLGALLLLQLIVQAWIHSRQLLAPDTPEEKGSTQKMNGTPRQVAPNFDLKDGDTMPWISGQQQRKCTLCLEDVKDPSVTPCGHIFCWSCIGDWCREKPECPLCRQSSLPQHILPLKA